MVITWLKIKHASVCIRRLSIIHKRESKSTTEFPQFLAFSISCYNIRINLFFLVCPEVLGCSSSLSCTTETDTTCTRCIDGFYLVPGNGTKASKCLRMFNLQSSSVNWNLPFSQHVQKWKTVIANFRALPKIIQNARVVLVVTFWAKTAPKQHLRYVQVYKGGKQFNEFLLECSHVPHCASPITCSNEKNSKCTGCANGFYLENSSCTSEYSVPLALPFF